MRYLLLIRYDEAVLDRLSADEWAGLVRAHDAFDDELRASGQFVAAQALQPVSASTTLRVRNGRLSVTDGPFAETKEQLGGFFLVEARDLDDALAVASRIPSLRLGGVEVRPIRPLTRSGA